MADVMIQGCWAKAIWERGLVVDRGGDGGGADGVRARTFCSYLILLVAWALHPFSLLLG